MVPVVVVVPVVPVAPLPTVAPVLLAAPVVGLAIEPGASAPGKVDDVGTPGVVVLGSVMLGVDVFGVVVVLSDVVPVVVEVPVRPPLRELARLLDCVVVVVGRVVVVDCMVDPVVPD